MKIKSPDVKKQEKLACNRMMVEMVSASFLYVENVHMDISVFQGEALHQ